MTTRTEMAMRLRNWHIATVPVDTLCAQAAELLDSAERELSALRATNAQCVEVALENAKLRAQLPEGMQHCTILFKECDKGHGWLTATNWVQHPCPTCENAELRKKLETMQKLATPAEFTVEENARLRAKLAAATRPVEQMIYTTVDPDRRVSNLRAIYADESVNHFARAICNEAAQALERLARERDDEKQRASLMFERQVKEGLRADAAERALAERNEDAERYRWIRRSSSHNALDPAIVDADNRTLVDGNADAAIDSARKAGT